MLLFRFDNSASGIKLSTPIKIVTAGGGGKLKLVIFK